MINRLSVKLVNWLLNKSNLTLEQRNSIVRHILTNLHGLPIASIISVGESGEILINNSPLDLEKAKQLRESAKIALDNLSLRLVSQEVLFTAIVGGLHKATNPEDLYFYRVAIWYGQQLEAQLKILAQRTDELSV